MGGAKLVKATEVWLEFYIGNYNKDGKTFEFSEVALYKPIKIDSADLEKLRSKLHRDLDLIIDHAKKRRIYSWQGL